jgi:CrcB protein
MFKSFLLVSAGGAVGSGFRYLTTILSQKVIGQNYPWGTFIANILGCLFIGILIGYFTKSQINNHDLRLLLVTGFCGGYTTFSAFALENVTFLQQGNIAYTILYLLMSVVLGMLAVIVGLAISQITP